MARESGEVASAAINAIRRAMVEVSLQRLDPTRYKVVMVEDVLIDIITTLQGDVRRPRRATLTDEGPRIFGIGVEVDDSLPPNVIELRHVVREEF